MAERLGRANVDALLRSLTAKQFQEWIAYVQLRVWDDDDKRADWRAALITKQIFDSHQHVIDAVFAAAGMKKHQRPKFIEVALKDFLLQWGKSDQKPKRKQTWEEQWKIVERIQAAYDSGVKIKES